MYAKRRASSWLFHGCRSETEGLEKRELRDTSLDNAALNKKTLIYTHFLLLRGVYAEHLPAPKQWVKMTQLITLTYPDEAAGD